MDNALHQILKRIVEEAIAKGIRLAISWSGGKDSTAMTHLIRSIADMPIIVQVDDCDWPQKRPYIDRVCDRFGWNVNDKGKRRRCLPSA